MEFLTPELAWTFEVDAIHSVDFSPFGNMLAVGGADSTDEQVFIRVRLLI